MTTIEQSRDLDIIEWIEVQTRLAERERVAQPNLWTRWSEFMPWPFATERPQPLTDDMRQMIEDIANAQ